MWEQTDDLMTDQTLVKTQMTSVYILHNTVIADSKADGKCKFYPRMWVTAPLSYYRADSIQ